MVYNFTYFSHVNIVFLSIILQICNFLWSRTKYIYSHNVWCLGWWYTRVNRGIFWILLLTHFEYDQRKVPPQGLSRPRKRLLELLAKTALDKPDPKLASAYASAEREWSMRFLRSPVEVLTSDGQRVSGIRLAKNRYWGTDVLILFLYLGVFI